MTASSRLVGSSAAIIAGPYVSMDGWTGKDSVVLVGSG